MRDAFTVRAMKANTLPEVHEQMSQVSKAMSKEQRVKNGKKAWQTRIKNILANRKSK